MRKGLLWRCALGVTLMGTAAALGQTPTGVTEANCHTFSWLQNAGVDQLKACAAHEYDVPDSPAPAGTPEANCHDYGWLKNATVEQLQACGRHDYEASVLRTTVPPPVQATGQSETQARTGISTLGSSLCKKNISFAVAFDGTMSAIVPDFAYKWTTKNGKKYPAVCFSQTVVGGATNYVLVFSDSSAAFQGLYPTVRTTTNTSFTPVSGSGTITDNYGATWSYTYNGTVTTTTTTTQQVDLPYIDRATTLYVSCYRQDGTSCGLAWRTVTTRTGGDPYNTLGYNLGSLLASIHMKQRLLRDAVNRVVSEP